MTRGVHQNIPIVTVLDLQQEGNQRVSGKTFNKILYSAVVFQGVFSVESFEMVPQRYADRRVVQFLVESLQLMDGNRVADQFY